MRIEKKACMDRRGGRKERKVLGGEKKK